MIYRNPANARLLYISSTTEKEQTGRIVIIRIAQIAPVVEVQPIIFSLEVERVIRRLPIICSFPPVITGRVDLNTLPVFYSVPFEP